MTDEERKAWEDIVKLANMPADMTLDGGLWNRTILAADAELTRLREELPEAIEACSGLHEMVKDLEKENYRLRALAERAGDVEGMAKVIDDDPVAGLHIAAAVSKWIRGE